MSRLCHGVFSGGEIEPGVFHCPVDTVLRPVRGERVEDEPDPAVPTNAPNRVLPVIKDDLEH